jgi:hypothetical protein
MGAVADRSRQRGGEGERYGRAEHQVEQPEQCDVAEAGALG